MAIDKARKNPNPKASRGASHLRKNQQNVYKLTYYPEILKNAETQTRFGEDLSNLGGVCDKNFPRFLGDPGPFYHPNLSPW